MMIFFCNDGDDGRKPSSPLLPKTVSGLEEENIRPFADQRDRRLAWRCRSQPPQTQSVPCRSLPFLPCAALSGYRAALVLIYVHIPCPCHAHPERPSCPLKSSWYVLREKAPSRRFVPRINFHGRIYIDPSLKRASTASLSLISISSSGPARDLPADSRLAPGRALFCR